MCVCVCVCARAIDQLLDLHDDLFLGFQSPGISLSSVYFSSLPRSIFRRSKSYSSKINVSDIFDIVFDEI